MTNTFPQKSRVLLVILAIGFVVWMLYTESKTQAATSFKKATCSQFKHQEEAQEFMNRYRASYLDRDKDGVACENLPL